MNNLHISLTELRHASRVLKEVSSIKKIVSIDTVYVASLHGNDLETNFELESHILVKRFRLITRNLNKSLFFQAIKYIEFFLKISLFYKNKNIRIVNVHTLALLPFGYLLKLFYGSILIYDTHELETETNGLCGLKKFVSKFVEYIFIGKVDHIFVVGENIANWYRDTYSINRPTVLLNSPIYQQLNKSDYFREKFNIRPDQFIALYQGGLSLGRGVDLLLETFSNRLNDKIVIVFMGYGDLEEKIKNVSTISNLIFFHKAVDHDSLLSYTASADLGIHTIKNTCLNHYYCMPNKIFQYAMAGLPVIISNMKEMKEFVFKYDMGLVLQTELANELNKLLDKIISMDFDYLRNNSLKAAESNSWELQECKLITSYKNILKIL